MVNLHLLLLLQTTVFAQNSSLFKPSPLQFGPWTPVSARILAEQALPQSWQISTTTFFVIEYKQGAPEKLLCSSVLWQKFALGLPFIPKNISEVVKTLLQSITLLSPSLYSKSLVVGCVSFYADRRIFVKLCLVESSPWLPWQFSCSSEEDKWERQREDWNRQCWNWQKYQ